MLYCFFVSHSLTSSIFAPQFAISLLSSASQCPNHQTVKESGAYLCGVLDERKRKKTNADRIRSMTDEELAMLLYEIGYDEGWDKPEYALKWLQQPAEEADNETVGERKDGDDNG